jgi:3-hydroxyacyl-CoA dehydrogenase
LSARKFKTNLNQIMNIAFNKVAVIGAGAMGRGIAQIAAQAGSLVFLYDTQADATHKAKEAVYQVWDSLVVKGRLESRHGCQLQNKFENSQQPARFERLRVNRRSHC